MGDRAIVHLHDGRDIGPAVYLHWHGSRVRGLLVEAESVMEGRVDVHYATARLIGVCHEEMLHSNTGLGTWSVPGLDYAESASEIRSPAYSHGDAGVFLVDIRTVPWTVESFNGYGLCDSLGNAEREAGGAPPFVGGHWRSTSKSTRCACGQKWPCAESERKDISGLNHASHHVRDED